jgi:acetyltransferase
MSTMVVRSDMKRQGLGSRLLRKMIDYCRARGTKLIAGDVLAENEPMLELVRHYPGFTLSESGERGIVRVSYRLD